MRPCIPVLTPMIQEWLNDPQRGTPHMLATRIRAAITSGQLPELVDISRPGPGPWYVFEDEEGNSGVTGSDPMADSQVYIAYRPPLHDRIETAARAIAVCAVLNHLQRQAEALHV